MKTLLTILVLFALLGCENNPDYYIDCAALDQGEMEIINQSKHDLLVDVTRSYEEENDPVLLDSGRLNHDVSTIFQEIYSGEVKVWWSADGGINWKWKTATVITCERSYCIISLEDL